MQIKNSDIYWKIKSLSLELGFADFGCAKASEVSDCIQNHYISAMGKGYFASMQYLHNNIEKRFNPCKLVDGASSVLVFLAPYSLPEDITPPNGISQFALGEDYHKVIKGKLYTIMEMLSKTFSNFQGRAFTDSAPVLEREWGVRAGLGFVGKNNFLISKSCGIKNFIATIICNSEIPITDDIEPEKKIETYASCGECHKCLDSCPTGALMGEYCMNAKKCISYHTIENRNLKEDIQNSIVPHFNNSFFGCDRCLDACPWNSKNKTGWSEFHTNLKILGSKGEEWWLGLSNNEFKQIFKDSSLLRGGLENIQTSIKWGKNIK